MKICLIQHSPKKGLIDNNIQEHLKLIDKALEHSSDMVVFSELSITGYEPTLAKKLALNTTDSVLKQFQHKADKSNITIAIGAPTLLNNELKISLIIFKPNCEISTYSKQILHEDEMPYFTCGIEQKYIEIDNEKIALGICYETLQKEHIEKIKQENATVYIASVSKPQRGITKAEQYFPSNAQKHQLPILMANSVGQYENFMSTGQSSIWNKHGNLISKLNDKSSGLLIYDTVSEQAFAV